MPKTTLTGVLTILSGLVIYVIAVVAGHATDPAAIGALVTAVTAGYGLIKAADATP